MSKRHYLLLCIVATFCAPSFADDFSFTANFAFTASDMNTVICINGVDGLDYAVMRAECALKFPPLREPLEKAAQDWRSRNAAALKEVAGACSARLQKLADNDPARLKEIRNFTDSVSKMPFSKRPGYIEDQFRGNCQGLAKMFTDPQSDIPSTFASEIRTSALKGP